MTRVHYLGDIHDRGTIISREPTGVLTVVWDHTDDPETGPDSDDIGITMPPRLVLDLPSDWPDVPRWCGDFDHPEVTR